MNTFSDRFARTTRPVHWLAGLGCAFALASAAMAQSSTGSAGSTTGAGMGTAAQPAQPVASGTPAGGNKAAKPPVAAEKPNAVVDKPAKAGTQSGAVTPPASGPTPATPQR